MSRPSAAAALRLTVLAGALTLAGSMLAPAMTATARDVDLKAPNATARQAGVERGNATMGWRAGVGRGVGAQARTETGGQVGALFHVTRPGKLVKMDGVLGIDVSSYQGVVDWQAFANVGRTFAYVKATEGSSYRNPYFSAQFGGAKSVGMYAGAYHFANPSGKSGKTQATYFVKHGGGWTNDGKTLPGVLDIEYNPYGGGMCYGLSKKKMVAWINAFVTTYKKLTTRDVVIYTTADWWKRCTGDTTTFRYTNPLWVARWTPKKGAGTLPGGWPYYTFWQYSGTRIDQSKFSNSIKRLKVLATQAK